MNLIANTGIQYLTFPIEINTSDNFRMYFHEWCDDKSKPDNEKNIAIDLKELTAIILNYRNKNETIENAIKLVNESKHILERIKADLGSKTYLPYFSSICIYC